jgi:hypothetical protein
MKNLQFAKKYVEKGSLDEKHEEEWVCMDDNTKVTTMTQWYYSYLQHMCEQLLLPEGSIHSLMQILQVMSLLCVHGFVHLLLS